MSTTTDRIKEFTEHGKGYQLSVTFSDMRRMAELLERAAEFVKDDIRESYDTGGSPDDLEQWLADFRKFQNETK